MTLPLLRHSIARGPISDVPCILSQIEHDDPSVAEQLLPLVYDELRKLAAARLTQEKSGQTLQATALVHEAYLRLVPTSDSQFPTPSFHSRSHFFGAAAEAMRRILIARPSDQRRLKRRGERVHLDLESITAALETPPDDLPAHEVLTLLESEYPDCAQLVKARFFAGLSLSAAATLNIRRRPADRLLIFRPRLALPAAPPRRLNQTVKGKLANPPFSWRNLRANGALVF